MALFCFCPAWGGVEWIDQIRGSTNKFWYEAVVNKCEGSPNALSKELKMCSKMKAENRNSFQELSSELQEKAFFDAVVSDMATKNQCEYESIQAMNIGPRSMDNQFTRANLGISQFIPDNKSLRVMPLGKPGKARVAKAEEAQQKLVSKYIEKAQQIVEKEKQLEKMRDVRSNDPRYSQVTKLAREIEIIKNTIPYGDKAASQDFFKSIYDTVQYERRSGVKSTQDSLLEKFTGTGPQSFQEQVVNKSLRNIVKSQQELAATKGNYSDQHGLKVKAFEEGHAERFLFGLKGNADQIKNFPVMHCELQAKYGIGSEISSMSNNLVASVATAGLGGGSLLMSKLVRAGALTRGTEVVYNSVSAFITASEFGYSIATNCLDNSAGAAIQDSCKVQQDIEARGVSEFADKEISKAECVSSIGFAALGGAVALKQAVKARQMHFENKLEKAGFLDSYQKADARIQSSALPSGYKSRIQSELKTAMKSVGDDGAPNPQLMEALAQEDPDTLYSMLKEINESNPDKSWAGKVRAWIKQKQLPSEEQLELETCLIQTNATKTTTCVPTKFLQPKPGSAG